MAKNIMVVFFMCIVVMGSLQFSKAQTTANMSPDLQAAEKIKSIAEGMKLWPQMESCVLTCRKECDAKGNANASCHQKCNNDCTEKTIGIFFNLNRNVCFLQGNN